MRQSAAMRTYKGQGRWAGESGTSHALKVQGWDGDFPEDKKATRVLGNGYLLGSAGSYILACRQCGHERFRGTLDIEHCWDCRVPLEPIKVSDLDSFWRPFWNKKGWLGYNKETS